MENNVFNEIDRYFKGFDKKYFYHVIYIAWGNNYNDFLQSLNTVEKKPEPLLNIYELLPKIAAEYSKSNFPL